MSSAWTGKTVEIAMSGGMTRSWFVGRVRETESCTSLWPASGLMEENDVHWQVVWQVSVELDCAI